MIFKNLTKILLWTYDDITGILWKHKFAASDVIPETLWALTEAIIGQILLAKTTDNQSDDFLRMLSKSALSFS